MEAFIKLHIYSHPEERVVIDSASSNGPFVQPANLCRTIQYLSHTASIFIMARLHSFTVLEDGLLSPQLTLATGDLLNTSQFKLLCGSIYLFYPICNYFQQRCSSGRAGAVLIPEEEKHRWS